MSALIAGSLALSACTQPANELPPQLPRVFMSGDLQSGGTVMLVWEDDTVRRKVIAAANSTSIGIFTTDTLKEDKATTRSGLGLVRRAGEPYAPLRPYAAWMEKK